VSNLSVNTITNAAGGNTAQINGMTPTADSLQGFRNRILNGGMVIDQRNAGAAVTGISATDYVLDRFQQFFSNCGSINVQQSADAPTGFTNSLRCEVNTTKTPAATDIIALVQRIEGYSISDLGFGTAAAKPITVSFWVKSSVVGTYVLYLTSSSSGDASYSTTYTINAANTWEFKTIVIPGDVANNWPNLTNAQGMGIVWGLGGGPDRYPTVLNAWTTEARFMSATSTSTQWISNAGATFYITGVQLEAGSVATPFERRPFGTELALCQRYFQVIKPPLAISAAGTVDTTLVGTLTYSVRMRAAPTVSQSGVFRYEIPFGDAKTQSSANVSLDAPSTNDVGAAIILGNFSSLVFNRTYRQDLNTNALLFSAEL
jgi:hypothetical protein